MLSAPRASHIARGVSTGDTYSLARLLEQHALQYLTQLGAEPTPIVQLDF
ncbi:MAG: hypothetical protein R3C56_01195 [Pirellulaceae bacterium]